MRHGTTPQPVAERESTESASPFDDDSAGAPASTTQPSHTVWRPGAVRPRWGWLVARGVGALAVLAGGAIHLDQWLWLYAEIPTIGPLFLLNFVASTLIGLALLAPLEHLAGRWASAAVAVVTAGGIALATGTLVALYVSERRPLFGFQEPGYDPAAITATRQAEVVAVVALGVSLIGRFATSRPTRRW
jgi:hypothetical protein